MQLPLPFKLRDDAKLSGFCSDGNEALLHHIKATLATSTYSLLYIWGNEGFGKTHLLQAICHAIQEKNGTAIYLPLESSALVDPNSLYGLENVNAVCLDGIDHIAGDSGWQEAVFGLFNAILDRRDTLLVVSGNGPPTSLTNMLPDLQSRLSLCTTFKINELSEKAKIQMLQARSMSRGLKLSTSVAEFLLSRCDRQLSKLFGILEKLDRASLAHQRRLTIPFVKKVLSL